MNQNSKPISSFESNNIPVRRECYRSSTLGEALKQATLDMKKAGKLNDEMNAKIMAHFDVVMAGYLSRAIPRLNFKSDEVNRYKLLDGNHAFKFQDVQLALSSWGGKDNLKIRLPNVELFAFPVSSAVRKQRNVSNVEYKPPTMYKFAQEKEIRTSKDEKFIKMEQVNVDYDYDYADEDSGSECDGGFLYKQNI